MQLQSKKKEAKNSRYVVHTHKALKAGLHHDLRLEYKNKLKSFAIPKLMPETTDVKYRLAIPTPDHDISWINFEGTIPNGMYGAGIVKIYDKGYYITIKKSKEEWIFELKGRRLKGIYKLTKIKNGTYEGKYNIRKVRKE